LPAAVRAVERILEIFKIEDTQKIALVGSRGMVGKSVGDRLKTLNLPFEGFDKGDELSKLKNFEVIISATGKEGLITKEMVQPGYIGIDLGYPKGDFTSEAVDMASLVTPVPGGVGPITVVELYENLAEA
jgi:methylenetetrahydrofolate dehydrogenase (NADP+)/methenyltetrahydrofolate cyclohydrolase